MIFGLNFDHLGGANVQDNFKSINTSDKEKTVWLHFDADSNETRQFIDQKLFHSGYDFDIINKKNYRIYKTYTVNIPHKARWQIGYAEDCKSL